MKTLLSFLFTFVMTTLFAQEYATWDGLFSGKLVGIESTLNGQITDAKWNGIIDAGGYLFNLEGSIDDKNVNGTMSDPQTGTSIPFRASISGNQLTIYIHDINPLSGLAEDMELVFIKTNQNVISSAPKPVGNANLDQRLVGSWRYTNSYVSGQFSFATDYFMQFNHDGTMLWTDGRTAGGGPDISMDSGTGDVHSASWKIENKVIWLDGGNGWEYYAKYYEENGSMLLTYQNGNKQVWEKL